jgi:hypothetical protein
MAKKPIPSIRGGIFYLCSMRFPEQGRPNGGDVRHEAI